jgi:hypothetical protein
VVAKPKFDFKGTTSDAGKFQATSEVLEFTGVSAYLGQVGNIASKKMLGAAGSILPVQAWHAARCRGDVSARAPTTAAKVRVASSVQLRFLDDLRVIA